jgi:hypothetical protein
MSSVNDYIFYIKDLIVVQIFRAFGDYSEEKTFLPAYTKKNTTIYI